MEPVLNHAVQLSGTGLIASRHLTFDGPCRCISSQLPCAWQRRLASHAQIHAATLRGGRRFMAQVSPPLCYRGSTIVQFHLAKTALLGL